jgi:hypothetical protein
MLILETLIALIALGSIAATAVVVSRDGYRRMPTRRY